MPHAVQKPNLAQFKSILSVLILLAVISCKKSNESQPNAVLIHGKNYPTITIGNQTWLAANYEGPGGLPYKTGTEKPEYGRYYTFTEVKAIALPAGWRLPTMEDYLALAENQGVVFTNFRATNQQAIKKLTSVTNWRKVAGNNSSGFNAHPAGYMFQESAPMDGDISEFWMSNGNTISIQEGANGTAHNIQFYQNSNDPAYRFNLRLVKTD